MPSRFLIGTLLCTLFLVNGAQYHPPSATTGAVEACNDLAQRSVQSETNCKASSSTFEWTTSKTITPKETPPSHTLTSLPTITSENTFSISGSDSTPTLLAAVTTITCTAATAMPRLELSIFPFIGVAMLGVIQGLVL